MKFNNIDLSQFIKTRLAQEIQKSQVGGFIQKKGAPPVTATVNISKLGEKPKVAEGIDMGQQVDKGVIPIIYGHVGMSNTQFDLGQKPSDIDAKFVTQEVKLPISEGSIAGVAQRVNDNRITFYTGDTVEHFKQIVINDSFVVDPTTSVANFKDIKFEMTLGDGTTNKQTATISDYNPLLSDGDDKIEAIDDPTNDRLLNDLGDVQAGRGVNYVLYWNQEANRWEAKSFNELLNNVGATYDGGAGGSGGDGGSGGSGGRGGTGGVGPITGVPLKYTQFNPPPAHVKTSGEFETETTITQYSAPSTVDANLGAPLRKESATDPYFTTTITDIDDATNAVQLTFVAPEGMYKEIVTTTTVKNGNIELCGTERPITNSGNLNCLTPDIEIAPDGQTATTKTRVAGTATVRYALVTELCGRDFILHEDTVAVSSLRNGFYSQTETVYLSSMNAGSGAIVTGPNAGSQQIGPTDDEATATCDPTDAAGYDYANYTLQDYLTTYPNQIIEAIDNITLYAWLEDTDEEEVSTPVYLQNVCVSDSMDVYESSYSAGETNTSPFFIAAPDYVIEAYEGDTSNANGYSLANARETCNIASGTYDSTKNPDPLVVLDGNATGSQGDTGSDGSSGTTGTTGSAGTSGSVTVPNSPNIPTAEMARDASYSGDGVADIVTLPSVTVINADALASNTLTISVTQGSVDVVTVPGSVSAVGRGTGTLTLIGTAANLQSCLDSGLKFSSTTATSGDVTIRFYISSSEGNSESTRQIRSEAVTEYAAPTFEIIVQNYVGTLLVKVKSKDIMATVTGATSNDATATAIAQAITSFSSTPNWTATAVGNIVTVTGPQGLGASYNGVQPTLTGTMGVQISEIGNGVTPSRVTQPRQSTKNLKGQFIPALAFTNTLDASDVSFAQIKYRPAQGDGETTLSEIGLYVGGRDKMQEPGSGNNLSFIDWQDAGYTSTLGWSNNPAWVFFDYLTNTTFGLGNDIILNEDQKFDLYNDIYNAGIWCDINPTGVAEQTAARFNGIFYGAESKYEALQKIADSFFAKFIYVNGNPRLIFDGYGHPWPDDMYTPSIEKLVNQSNASEFMYQSGSIDNIYNVINVKWNNPENFFRLEEVQYRNEASIAKFGERETSIELTGCTSKQQALWHGAWMYETEASNSETVTYIAGWDHFDIIPGSMIHLNDTLRPGNQTLGGRVVSDNGDGTVTLDRDAGTGSIAIVDSFGYVKTGTVSGTTATISTNETKTVDTTDGIITYTADFADDAVWNTYSGDLEPNYRVIAIEESEDGIYAVTAQKHDPDKYNRIWANII